MKTLMLVFCWEGDMERIGRHYPFWYQGVGDNIWFICPEDRPVTGMETVICHERSEQFGPSLMRRMIYGMNLAVEISDADAFMVMEADSITLGKVPDHPLDGVRAVIYPNGDPKWNASVYIHTPWWIDRASMRSVVDAMKAIPPESELGFPDRHLALALKKAGIVPQYDKRLVSFNQLDLPRYMDSARKSVAEGAFAIHGLKTELQLRQLLA